MNSTFITPLLSDVLRISDSIMILISMLGIGSMIKERYLRWKCSDCCEFEYEKSSRPESSV